MITNALKRGTSAGGGVCRAVIRQAQPLIGIALHGSAGRLRRKFHRTVTCCHQNGKGGQGGRQVDRDSRLFWNLSSIHRVFVGDAGGLTAPGSCG